jgi:soluble lytic murein transglycosylase-like protein
MSIASLAAVTNRVGEIQSRIGRIAPNGSTFGQALAAAQTAETAVVPDGTTYVTPQATASTSWFAEAAAIPVGMLGTPVLLQAGIGSPQQSPGVGWTDALPAAGQAWAPAIETAATQAGIDPRLLAALVWQESGFQPDAISRSGAIGLAQLMPATADGLNVDPTDPLQNLDGGARYLAWTIREFGSIELGLAAYNAGPGTVRESGGIPDIPETRAYVPRVLDYYNQLGGIA